MPFNTEVKDKPSSVTQLAAAMAALGLYRGANTLAEHAAEAKRLGGENAYRVRLANALLGAAQTEAVLAEAIPISLEREPPPTSKRSSPQAPPTARRKESVSYAGRHCASVARSARSPRMSKLARSRSPRRADLTADGYARLSYRQTDTLWKKYTPAWDLHQLRHTAISARAAHGYSEVELKRFSGHLSLRSLEVYIAQNREAAKRKARIWERHDTTGR